MAAFVVAAAHMADVDASDRVFISKCTCVLVWELGQCGDWEWWLQELNSDDAQVIHASN